MLKRQAVEGPTALQDLHAVDPDDVSLGKQVFEDPESAGVTTGAILRDENHVISDVKVRVRGRQPSPPENDRLRKRQIDHLQPTA